MYSNRFGVDVGSSAGVAVALASGVGVATAAGEVAGVADAVEGPLVAEAAGEVGCEAGGVPMIARPMTPPTNTQATMTQPRKPPLFFGCGGGACGIGVGGGAVMRVCSTAISDF